jgi:hypothetical protein
MMTFAFLSKSTLERVRIPVAATTPAYIASTCWNPKTASLPAGNTSSTGCTPRSVPVSSTLSPDTFPPPSDWRSVR